MENSVSIHLKGISKKFNREWIFKGVDYVIAPGDRLVILGGNGSGKSTLLQVISGYLIADKGEITFISKEKTIEQEQINEFVSIASPFLQLTEEFTLTELIDHTGVFKPFKGGLKTKEVIRLMDLEHAAGKPLKHFSSGMKQRVKLGLAILASAPVILLDEPLSNLDFKAIEWYKKMIAEHGNGKTIIVCSNAVKDEYFFCSKELDILNYKEINQRN